MSDIHAPPYIIAELSGNHNGKLEKALRLIEAAAEAGADAVKLQTYTADTMTIDVNEEEFKIRGGLWDGYSLYQLYQWAYTPWEWHEELFKKAKECGLDCFSSPFDESAVDFLEKFNPPFYKIASFEMTDLPLLEYIAKKKRSVIMSTGMGNLEEIRESVQCLKRNGCEDITLLHCVSSYPAPAEQYNLRTISDLKEKFGLRVGLSDHTLGNKVAILSIAMGAEVIEKHFTLNRSEGGPDSAFSLEPDELKELCKESKTAWQALGRANYDLQECEKASLTYRRSIYVVKDIKKGEKFTNQNIRRIRPGYGLPCKFYDELLGKKASEDLFKGKPLKGNEII